MMAIEGAVEEVNRIAAQLKTADYPSTNCEELGDKDGNMVEFFMISRSNKPDFLMQYKKAKSLNTNTKKEKNAKYCGPN